MLQIQHIKKDYRTGDLVQHALNDVSVNLRDNEFVAILGPSGSGKTTLLNVIGGLDRYDSGDLIINGVSTKKYKDRDWDSYRNHTIGFVFQSYNLIMHQTVLANVELALTISGISGSKRREKAKAALEKVGLADHMYKKPGQMSGGQMQRVAIARALVNDPDIVLADEPTGALDSDTSVQVMDLLQEVAKDRLVVMVTHNPELAKEYATRIVTIKDGKVLSDTDPFEPAPEETAAPVHKNMGRSSMSFLTALSLSFNNLRTKKARTILVAFAGSIGIIGIALILSLSTGVNRYIQYQESETLSEYPLQLQKTGFDLTSLMSSGSSGSMLGSSSSASTDTVDGKVNVAEVVTEMFGGVSTNNLKALKTFLDSGDSGIEPYVRSIEYKYQVTPQIYMETEDEILQVNPGNLFEGISAGDSSLSTMLSMSSSANFFYELPQNEALYKDSYMLAAGRWPADESELVLVLGNGGRISDLVLYGIGIKDRSEIESKFKGEKSEAQTSGTESSGRQVAVEEDTEENDTEASASEAEEIGESVKELVGIGAVIAEDGEPETAGGVYVTSDDSEAETESEAVSEVAAVKEDSTESASDSIYELYDYEDFLGRTFKLVHNSSFYTYDEEYGVWTNKSGNSAYTEQLVREGKELTITGIIQPKEGSSAAMLTAGIGYTHELMQQIMEEAENSEAVTAQLSDPDMNIFTGRPFGEERDASDINLGDLFSVDEEAIAELFGGDMEGLDFSSLSGSLSAADLDLSGIDLSGLDLSGLDLSGMQMPDMDLSKLDLSSLGLSEGEGGDLLTTASEVLDLEALAEALPTFSREQLSELADLAVYDLSDEEIETLLQELADVVLEGYIRYIGDNSAADFTRFGSQLQTWMGTGQPTDILQAWLENLLASHADQLLTEEELRETITDAASGFASSLLLQGVDLPDMSELNGLTDILPVIQQYWTQFETYLASSNEIAALRSDVLTRVSSIMPDQTQQADLLTKLSEGYTSWAERNEAAQPEEIRVQFLEYLQTDEVKQILSLYAEKLINVEALSERLSEILGETMSAVGEELGRQLTPVLNKVFSSVMDQITGALTQTMQSLGGTLSSAMTSAMGSVMNSLMGSMGGSLSDALTGSLTDMFTINPDALADAVSFNMSVDEIGELLTSLLSEGGATMSDNLAALGYADESDPYEIDIYPVDFESKNAVTKVLDDYNQRCVDEGREDESITYTDYVAAMMSSVTRIIDTISYVLIAFVAISLIVSSIMIGVITYISVLERRKEIGVLRAIGASKNNVSQVFNAETFITGLLAGSLGVIITILLTIPINALLDYYVNQEGLSAQLPAGSAGILVVLSVILTMIAGLIPSGKAAKSDPVSALRSD